MTSSVIGYYGSKHSIAEQIVRLMPEHRGYIEPFCGSLAVLAAKRPSSFECVNDLDGDLMTFWRVLRDRCDELERMASLTPHSRAQYTDTWPPSGAEDDLARAWRVWVQLTQGRGGQLRRTGWRYHEVTRGRGSGMPVTLAGYVGRFAAAADRLRNVSLECLPALEVIGRYGRDAETLMYVDPPYLGSTRSRNGYQFEMNGAGEHTELAEALHRCEATVILSGYASPLYDDELYGDWHRHEIQAWTGQGRAEHSLADGRRPTRRGVVVEPAARCRRPDARGVPVMPWSLSWRADPRGAEIADRHYNRQSPGAAQFVPPGRCLVLRASAALWVTSWPLPEYVMHEWPGAWMNTTFRREGGELASDLIRSAVAATRWTWPEVPEQGMVTFVDASKVRHKRDPGRCYLRAGFRQIGTTKAGLIALGLARADMPEPEAPLGAQLALAVTR